MADLKSEFDSFKAAQGNIANSVIKSNINNNVIVNDFGNEDRSHIAPELIEECLKTFKIMPLVEKTYFDPDKPENQTIKCLSSKKKIVMIRKGGQWEPKPLNLTVDEMIQRENTTIASYFYKHKWNDATQLDDAKKGQELAYIHAKLLAINNRNEEFYGQRALIKQKLSEPQNRFRSAK